jgi:hypothetical protein
MRDPRRPPPRKRTPRLPGVPRPGAVRGGQARLDADRPEAAQSSTPALVVPRAAPPARAPNGFPPRPVAPAPVPDEEAPSRRLIAVTTLVSWLAALALMTTAVLLLVNRDVTPPDDESGHDRADVVTRVPEAPVPLPADASYTQLWVLPGDVLAVQQWITDSSGFARLTVTAPDGQVRGESLQVYVDGVLVEQRATIDGRESAVDLGGAKAVYLRYRLSGALERSRPPAGRALARVTSLDLSYDARPGPTTIAFEGAEVLTLACQPTHSTAPPLPCGVAEGDTWQVQPPPGESDYEVMAQLDLAETSQS